MCSVLVVCLYPATTIWEAAVQGGLVSPALVENLAGGTLRVRLRAFFPYILFRIGCISHADSLAIAVNSAPHLLLLSVYPVGVGYSARRGWGLYKAVVHCVLECTQRCGWVRGSGFRCELFDTSVPLDGFRVQCWAL